jgi:hypothetical protein
MLSRETVGRARTRRAIHRLVLWVGALSIVDAISAMPPKRIGEKGVRGRRGCPFYLNPSDGQGFASLP